MQSYLFDSLSHPSVNLVHTCANSMYFIKERFAVILMQEIVYYTLVCIF